MLDGDFNAARIVLKRGLAQVGQDMPELKPAERGLYPSRQRDAQARSVKQELYAMGIMPCLGPSLCETEEPRE